MKRLALLGLLLLARVAFGATVIEDDFTRGVSTEREMDTGTEPEAGPILGPQRMLAILVDFPSRPSPLTRQQVADAYAQVIHPFYDDVSYGRITVPVTDVVGPFAVADSCDFPLQSAFDAADPTVDFRNYDYVSVWGDFDCGWGGIAFLGKQSQQTADGIVSIGMNNDDSGNGQFVTAGINIHELGHNFTIHHAGFLNCGSNTLTANRVGCFPIEYGDPYSDMGNFAFHNIIGYFEPPQRLQAGWLDPTSEVFTDPANGRYSILAHERPEHGIQKALRFHRPNGDELWVSARSPLGFDTSFPTNLPGTDVYSGALLHVLDTYGIGKPLLLDAEPPTPDNVKAVLLPGQTFTDPETGVSVTTVSRSADQLTVDVVHGPVPSTTTTIAPPPTTTTTSTTLPPGPGCSQITPIPAQGGTVTAATSGGSALSGSCGGSQAPEKVYSWTPNISGIATITTCGGSTNYDTVVYVRRDSCVTGTQIACNDDSGCTPSLASRVTPTVTAGVPYFIVVDGFGFNSGTFTLTVTPPGGGTTTTTTPGSTTTTVRPSTTTTVATTTTTLNPFCQRHPRSGRCRHG